ncbi:RICIN domain-containing protein [Longispora sp. NPDC051575]|uniref:RICIN domain-containing protein n=1 Tax=Longispora sp. NPDC051575 TaxID=3154943 RepID=UPI0034369746
MSTRTALVGLAVSALVLFPGVGATAAPDSPAAGTDGWSSAPFFAEPLPPGATPVAPLAPAVAHAQIAANPVVCEGDGVTGKRIEVLYVREASQPDRYAAVVPSLQAYAAGVDDAYNDSAAQTGGSRHVRYVTTAGAGCQLTVGNLVVPDGTYTSGAIRDRAIDAGYYNADRDYLMFSDNAGTCGGTWGDNDDQPGPANAFNNGRHYSEIAVPCWGVNATAHELGHQLGAVLPGAPHYQGGGHCSQEWDLMCYGDTQSFDCPQRDGDRLMDCGHDDYYSTNPTPGSWLATHWNVANSAFLIKANTPDNNDGHAQGGKTYVITSAVNGEAIEVVGAGTGGLVELSHRTRVDSASQKWVLGYDSGLQLVNANSQLCADSAYSGTAPGTHIIQYNCNGQNGMRWAFRPVGSGKVAIFNYLTGYAVTDGGAYPASLVQQPYTGATNQQWTLNEIADPGPQPATNYYLTSASNGDSAAVVGGSTSSGAQVTHLARQNVASQKWKLVAVTGGYWRIVNVNSNLCLRPVSGGTTAGALLEQWTCGTATSQQWTLVRTADTRYGLVNRASGLAVREVDNGTASILEQRPFLGGSSDETVWGLVPA